MSKYLIIPLLFIFGCYTEEEKERNKEKIKGIIDGIKNG